MPGWETPTAEVTSGSGVGSASSCAIPTTAEVGATGEYTVGEPPHRLVFNWVWDDDPDQPQLIKLEFTEQEGRTLVRMTNCAIPTDGRLKDQERGWLVLRQSRPRAA